MSLFGNSAPSAVVGLDIGTDLIKVAEAKSSKGGIQITGLGVAPIPPGVVENGVVIDPQLLGGTIKKLLHDSGIKTHCVVSTITGQSSVVIRVITQPKMNDNELAEAMKWEIERQVPFSSSAIQKDYAKIEKPGTPPDAQTMDVLLAVAQDSAVDSHLQALKVAGLQPKAIDIQPLATSRALIDSSPAAQQHSISAIVNVGANTTDVGIYEGGLLTFPGPPISIGGANFTRAISEFLGVSIEEAERLKKESAAIDVTAMQAGMVYDDGSSQQEDDPMLQSNVFDPSFHASPINPEDEPESSPFEIGAAPAAEPPVQQAPPMQSFDISGEDVFDLGGGPQVTQFSPSFDLDDPEPTQTTPAAPAESVFNFDLEDDQPAIPVGEPFAQPDDDQPVVDPQVAPAPPAAPALDDAAQTILQAIAPVLIELATEIRRSLEYYTTQNQKYPDHIYLCGGTAKMRDLDMFLATELGVPVQIADPLSNFIVQCPKYSPQYLSEVSPLFPVSIGLAIRELMK